MIKKEKKILVKLSVFLILTVLFASFLGSAKVDLPTDTPNSDPSSGDKINLPTDKTDLKSTVSGFIGSAGTYLRKLVGIYKWSDGEFWLHIGAHVVIGFLAAISLFFIAKFTNAKKKKKNWYYQIAGTRNRVFLFTIIYTVLLQVGVLNRIIEIATFTFLTPWPLSFIMVAIYVGVIPAAIMWYVNIRRDIEEQTAIRTAKLGIAVAEATAKQAIASSKNP